MKKFYSIIMAVISMYSYQTTNAQCNGVKGPNLLGAKGTFSAPFITENTGASACISSGSNTFNPAGNIGNALSGCAVAGTAIPCSDYTYSSLSTGLTQEFRYSVLKTIGDNNGGNCIKGDWRGKEHTGDGGYFLAVNGAPNTNLSPVFYKIKSIPVCIGATYEFSAWVINLLPATSSYAKEGAQPNISFRVNGTVIANSGLIPYTNTPTWVKVSGSFVATADLMNLEVINATSAAGGNDLGLDDISFNVCESQIAVNGPSSSSSCSGSNIVINYVVSDNTQANTWYKWQVSTDGGITFNNTTNGSQATYVGNSYTLTNTLNNVTSSMNGYKYRLAVSTSQPGLSNPACIYFNDYTLLVADCGPLPVQLTSFTGRYAAGKAILDWQTSQELNSDRFELFRSTDGQDFEKVGSIKSAGNSNTIKNYSYLDNITGNAGNHVYYRLKQIDIDGKATFSSILKLNLAAKTSFEVFPNPFTNNFTVSFGANKTATATIRIQNSAGNLVYSKVINVIKGNNSLVMNSLPTLGAGVYYVTVYNEEINFNGKLQKL